jgi:TonB-linked SusC/RagA family outer membrane protein
MKGLVFRTSYGQKYGSYSSRSYVPRYYLGSKNQATEDRISQAQSSGTGFQWENTLNYKIQLAGAHKVDLLLGQSIEKNGIGEYVNGYNSNSIFTTYENAYLDNVTTIIPGKVDLSGGPFLINSLSSFFGRLNYDYREKYLLTLIMRADGSSNFAPGNRWGYFPSVAAGWIVTNESFLDPVKGVLNYFKLRGSWGQNGNQSIPPFQYLATYSFTDVYYFFGTDKLAWTTGAYPGILPNEDISWETSEQINLGFDSRFLNSKLGLVFDWYRKNTKDWLVQAPVLATWGGATPPYINGGDIRNQGFEAALNWFDKAGAFTYGFNFNAAYNQNEVTRIENEEGIIEGAIEMFRAGQEPVYRTQVGYPIGYFYGFETAGVFQNQQQIDNFDGGIIADYPPEPGDLIFVDQNKDGVIDDLDKTMIGDPNPHIILGISANLSYKGFDFSVTANGVFGNDIAVSLHQPDSYKDNYPVEYLKRWHGEGTSDRYPRLLGNHPNYLYFSDISIEKGNYLRIQNITLGYDLKKLMPKAFLNQTRIYVAAQNPFIFTNYYGSDPEVGFAKDEWAKGVDIGFYPSPRTFMVGLNVKF